MASPQSQSATGDFIQSQIGIKVNYLNDLSAAIDQHQDRKVYQLLNQSRFDHEVLGKEATPNHPSTVALVDNLHDELIIWAGPTHSSIIKNMLKDISGFSSVTGGIGVNLAN